MPGFQLPAVGDKPLQSQWLQEQLCCSSQFWGLVRVCSAGFMQAHLRGGGGVLSSAGGPGGLGGPRWPHCRVCWLVLAVREAPPLSPSTRMGGVTAHPPFDLIDFLTWGSWHFKRQRQKLCHFLSLWP